MFTSEHTEQTFREKLQQMSNTINEKFENTQFSQMEKQQSFIDNIVQSATPEQVALAQAYELRSQYLNNLRNFADAYDNDGRIGETIDMAKASVYGASMRLLSALDFGTDILTGGRRISQLTGSDLASWADNDARQMMADAWAGVKLSTREAYAQGMMEADEHWNNGNYARAIIGWMSQIDRVLADSASSMVLMTAGGVATGGLGVAGAVAARTGSAAVGSVFSAGLASSGAALDMTLRTMDEFRANNGYDMPGHMVATLFAANTATLIPQQFLIAIGFDKLLPTAVSSQFHRIYQPKALPSRLQLTAGATAFETVQEGMQDVLERYFSQEQTNKQTFSEKLFTQDTIKAGIIGGLAGGTLTGTASGITAPFAIKSEAIRNRYVQMINNREANESSIGISGVRGRPLSDSAIEFSNSILEKINQGFNYTYKELTKFLLNPNLSEKAAFEVAKQRSNQIMAELVKGNDKVLKEFGHNRETAFEEFVFYSDVHGAHSNQRSVTDVSISELNKRKDMVVNVGKQLGFTESQINRIISASGNTLKYGSSGYFTLSQRLDYLNTKLGNKSLSKSERNLFETMKSDLEKRLSTVAYILDQQIQDASIKASSLTTSDRKRVAMMFADKGKQLYMDRSELVNDPYTSGKGIHGIIQNIVKSAKELSDIQKRLKISNPINMNSIKENLKRYRTAIHSLQKKAKTESKSTKPTILTQKELTQVIKNLVRAASTDNTTKKGSILSDLQNLTKEQLKQVQQLLKAKPNQKAQEAFDSLQGLLKQAKTFEQEVTKEGSAVRKIAEKFKDTFTKSKIENLNTPDEFNKILGKVKPLWEKLKRLATVDNSYETLAKYYEDRLSELVTKREDLDTKQIKESKEYEAKLVQDAKTKPEAVDTLKEFNNVKQEFTKQLNRIRPNSKIQNELHALVLTTMLSSRANQLGMTIAELHSIEPFKFDQATNGLNVFNQFIGSEADLDAVILDKKIEAESRLKQGDDPELVRQQTGWLKGLDGELRYEVSDFLDKIDFSGVIVSYLPGKVKRGSTMLLHEVYQNEVLYSHYPQLHDVEVHFAQLKGRMGYYDYRTKRIVLNVLLLKKRPDILKQTLVHEVQHAIQHIENWARGGSVSEFYSIPIKTLRQGLFNALFNNVPGGKELEKIHKSWRGIDQNKLSTLSQQYPELVDQYQSIRESSEDQIRGTYVLNLAGEIEADVTMERIGLSTQQRIATKPEFKFKSWLKPLVIAANESITKKNIKLHQTDQNTVRGTYDALSFIVSLTNNANASTTLHEGSHAFLQLDIKLANYLINKRNKGESLTSGERQLLASVATTLNWFNQTNNNQLAGDTKSLSSLLKAWNNLSFNEMTGYHEQYARGFEQYILIGKAPINQLQPIFSQLMRWFRDVYGSVKDFLSRNKDAKPLNNKMIRVFDKLFSDATIENKQQGLIESIIDQFGIQQVEFSTEAIAKIPSLELAREKFTQLNNHLKRVDFYKSHFSDKYPQFNELSSYFTKAKEELTEKGNVLKKAFPLQTYETVRTKSDYVINEVFKTLSAIYQIGSKPFKLINELRVGQPETKFAIEPLAKVYEHTDLVNKTVSELIPDFKKTTGLKPDIKDQKAYINTLISKHPAMRVLYDMDINHQTGDIKLIPNQNVLLAIDFSMRQGITTMDFNPTEVAAMRVMYGISEDTSPADFVAQVRQLAVNNGVMQTVVADMLGRQILKNLGLVVNTHDGTVNFYDRLATDLGTFALRYAHQNKWITINKFVPTEGHFLYNKETAQKLGDNYAIEFIKLNRTEAKTIRTNYKGTKENNFQDGLKVRYLTESQTSEKPTQTPSVVGKEPTVRHTNGIAKVADYVRSVYTKLFGVPYTLNKELVTRLENVNQDALLYVMGYIDEQSAEFKAMSKNEKESQLGRNETIRRELEDLVNLNYEGGQSWFFKWFMAKNGRTHINSREVNPQGNKLLQRFMIIPEGVKTKFTYSPEQMNEAYYAIAQAFDNLGHRKYTEQFGKDFIKRFNTKVKRNELFNDLVTLKENKFKQKYGFGIENRGHALNVFEFVDKYWTNYKNKVPFDSYLVVENDSATSGYFIKMLLFPNPKLLKEFGDRVGILPKNYKHGQMSMHELKKMDGFNDLYKTMAQRLILPSIHRTKDMSWSTEIEFNEQTKVLFNTNQLEAAYVTIFDALPQKAEDGSITKELRELFKNPTMIFGYTAGKESISGQLSRNIMNDLINKYLQIIDGKEINISDKERTAIINTFNFIQSKLANQGNLANILRETLTSRIWLKDIKKKGNVSLEQFFNEVLAPTYGQSVWNVLEESFRPFMDFNSSMNVMFNTMFKYFELEFNKRMAELNKKYGNEIPLKVEREVINDLFTLMPVMRLAYSQSLDQGMLLMNSERKVSEQSAVQTYYKNEKGQTVSDTTHANVRKWIDANKAGAVLPIHFSDATMMMMLMHKYTTDILPIHDAYVGSAFINSKVSRDYNKNAFMYGRDFNLYQELVNRFKEVINNAKELGYNVNTDNIIDKFGNYSETSINPIDGTTITNTPTIQEWLNNTLEPLVKINNNDRDAFYGTPNDYHEGVTITNMDGSQGSHYTVTGKEEYLGSTSFTKAANRYRKVTQDTLGSDPSGFTASETLEGFERTALYEPRSRIQMLKKLFDMDRNKVSRTHLTHLSHLVEKINLNHAKELVIDVFGDFRTQGMFLPAKDGQPDRIKIAYDKGPRTYKGAMVDGVWNPNVEYSMRNFDGKRNMGIYSFSSMAELFAHEMVHAGIWYPIENHRLLKQTKNVQALLDLHRQAKLAKDTHGNPLITWKDFLPENYDPAYQAIYEAKAKELYSYIFDFTSRKDISKEKNIEQLRSLHEFVAYGMTHSGLMSKLQQATFQERNIHGKVSLLDRLLSLGTALINMFTNKGTLTDVKNVLKGIESYQDKYTLLESLEKIHDRINGIHTSFIGKLSSHPLRLVEIFSTFIGDLVSWGDKTISPFTSAIPNLFDRIGYRPRSLPVHASILDYGRVYLETLALFAFSRNARQRLGTFLSETMEISQQSAVQTILRDIQQPGEMTSRLESLAQLTRVIERASKLQETIVKEDLLNGFKNKGKDLTEIHKKALTEVGLRTDLSSLLENETSIEVIKDFLNHPEKIQGAIDTIHSEFLSLPKIQSNFYKTHANLLGEFMVTQNGFEAGLLNAHNIAGGVGLGENGKFKFTPELIKKIDQLATLHALQYAKEYTPDSMSILTIMINEDTNGVQNFLQTHKTFVQETSDSNFLLPIHQIKGYTKALMDGSIDVQVKPISERSTLEESGYEFIRPISNQLIGRNDLAIYRRTWNTREHRQSATLLYSGQNAIGTSLFESAYELWQDVTPGNIDMRQVRDTKNALFVQASKIASKMNKLALEGKLTNNIAKQMTKGYLPIISPDGKYSDFRVGMTLKEKSELFNMNHDGIEIMGKMYAQKNTKMSASIQNQIIADFLENDMKQNMDEFTKRTKDQNFNYILMEKDSPNQFLREAWKLIPKELMEKIKIHKDTGGFYIRDSWLLHLFGSPSYSLADNQKVIDYTNHTFRKGIRISESIFKFFAFAAKQNIVIRMPVVLISNIMSNIGYSIGMGSSPINVANKQLQNAKAIRDYMVHKKELERIRFRERNNTATKEESASKGWLEAKLTHNIVHPLMEKGMYQAIVEDISGQEIETVGKINKIIDKYFKFVPKPIKWLARQAYMTEGTPYFDFMFQATQYSDFIARATEYQLHLEKYDKEQRQLLETKKITKSEFDNYKQSKAYENFEKELTFRVWNAFVNYDKPQSSGFQYLNDMGLVMFTKWAIRIQHQLTQGLTSNPVSTLLFLVGHSQMMQSGPFASTIYDYIPWEKNWLNLVNSPHTHVLSTLIPVPLHPMILGKSIYPFN